MPVVKQENNSTYSWAIWKITESESELLLLANLNSEEKAEYDQIRHPNKRMEYLAGRLVLRKVVEQRNKTYHGIFKDDCGKPFLNKHAEAISMSHSFPLAGAIIHKEQQAGIDIERPQPKLFRIAHKFLTEEELNLPGTDENTLCIYWCAKEALYKIYGRRHVIFSEHLLVAPFTVQNENIIKAKIALPEFQQSITLKYIFWEGYVICFNV